MRRHARLMWRPLVGFGVVVMTALSGSATPLSAQELADFDYENLSLRGIGVEWGYLWPNRVETDPSFGVRFDLGYLGPGVRITPSATWWESKMVGAEVSRLETRVADLANRSLAPGTAPVEVDLGDVFWRDLVLGVDAQAVWSIPWGFLSYTGVGAAAHIQNGWGEAVDDTFVEDLLDAVVAGFNVHTGLEYPVADWLRLHAVARYEWMADLRYVELRFGSSFMFGPSAPGELR